MLLLASTVVCLQANSPYGDQSDRALAAIQWLESWRQREVLKLVFNRQVRTRMPGGVGGAPGNRAPIPIDLVRQFCAADLVTVTIRVHQSLPVA